MSCHVSLVPIAEQIVWTICMTLSAIEELLVVCAVCGTTISTSINIILM